MAMGGAYSALANDISSAYWNPAGLVNSDIKVTDVMVGEGVDGNFGLEKVPEFINSLYLIKSYWNRDADFMGSVNGIAGLSLSKVGVSYIPWATVNFSKDSANTYVYYDGTSRHSVALTFGSSIGMPLILSPVAVGANVRYVSGFLNRVSWTWPGPANITYASGSGIGLDLGAQTNILPNTKAALVFRDVLTGFTWSGKTDIHSGGFNTTGDLFPKTGEEDFEEVDKSPMKIVLGVASDIPMIALLSADYEYADPNADIHIGIEKKFFMNIFALRAGYYTESATQTSKTTYGCGLDFGFIKADVAVGQDAKVSDDKILVMSASAVI